MASLSGNLLSRETESYHPDDKKLAEQLNLTTSPAQIVTYFIIASLM